MPRAMINEPYDKSYPTVRESDRPDDPPFIKMTMSWGWDTSVVDNWGRQQAVALVQVGDEQVGLDWGDLDRLNRAVRRAMKHYRKSVD